MEAAMEIKFTIKRQDFLDGKWQNDFFMMNCNLRKSNNKTTNRLTTWIVFARAAQTERAEREEQEEQTYQEALAQYAQSLH